MPRPGVFSRQASGLVREVSVWNTLAFNVMDGNIGVGLVWVLLLGAGLYPGANLYLAIAIAYLGILPLNVLYARLSAVYARSGGDYTYMTRLLHPSVGFAINVAAMVYFTMFVGVGGLYTVEYGLAPMLRVWAAGTGNETLTRASVWLSGTGGTLLVSLLILAAFAALLIVGGRRRFFRVQSVSFIVGMAALVAIVLVALVALAHDGARADRRDLEERRRRGAEPARLRRPRPLLLVGDAARRDLALDHLPRLLLLGLHRRRGEAAAAHAGDRHPREHDLGPRCGCCSSPGRCCTSSGRRCSPT